MADLVPPSDLHDEDYDYLFKIVMVGDPGVGKTCLVRRFKFGTFTERHVTTIGVDFAMKTIPVDGKKVKLQVWDTAGEERFRTITQSYYRSAYGVLIVYDISRMETFQNVAKWLHDIRRYTSDNIVKILIGNKSDLNEAREVDSGMAGRFAEHNEFLGAIETSAKTNANVQDLFVQMAQTLTTMYGDKAELTRRESKRLSLKGTSLSRSGCCSGWVSGWRTS